MKKITITFLTKTGEEAYKSFKAVPQSWKERQILKHIFKEKVINSDPLKIEIKVKKGAMIELALITVDITNKIRDGLKEKGCIENTDYIILEE